MLTSRCVTLTDDGSLAYFDSFHPIAAGPDGDGKRLNSDDYPHPRLLCVTGSPNC